HYWAFLTFGLSGLVLMIVQFVKRHQTYIPGFAGIFCLLVMLTHYFRDYQAVLFLDELEYTLRNLGGVSPFWPKIESLFTYAVAPPEKRFVAEEGAFICLVLYLISMVILSIQNYKRTGKILEDVSLVDILAQKQKRPKRSQTNELGSGDLASTEQISKWLKPTGEKYDTKIQVQNLRGSGGEAFKSSTLYIPREQRNKHILTVAKTGSGKTSQIILPILYSDCMCPERSTIVIDSKPEMWDKLAGLTRKYNPHKRILLFNPLDMARSLSWNILGKIEDDTDCKLIANTIIMATDVPSAKSDSPFFRNNALAILNSIMVGLLHDPSDVLSMPRVHELVQGGMKPLCDWLEAHPKALRNTRTFIELARSGSQNADTIMSELSMRLSAWDLRAIRATTYNNELDLETLIKEPTLFIVELRESELEMLRPMANVIVVEVLRYLTKYAERCSNVTLPRPVSLVIDEFASSLGRLPDIHVKLNTLRSRNVSIVAAIQSIAQVKANYGDDADSVLAGFNTKIFMPALDIQDAEWASKETGQMTIRFQTASTGHNKKLIEWFASKNDSTQEQVQQRAVLTPDEIGRPVDNIATFFLPKMPVFQGFLVPFFEVPEMLRRIIESEQSHFSLRDKPIEYEEKLPEAGPASSSSSNSNYLPPGISNTKGWTDEQIQKKLDETMKKLDWENTTGSARKWWEAFENENKHRKALVLRLAEELAVRKATVTEFFLAYVYSNTDNIQANLSYLDYTRLKKQEEKRKREAAAKAKSENSKESEKGSGTETSNQAAA
ncbi:MAG: type IV secretory system conjugative DNA transfer family protein, partial [Bdellovibrionales bacterium]|nr:type IV secretory system conjugative DNA transfer family protein [Bdellovibrionales bacterium]